MSRKIDLKYNFIGIGGAGFEVIINIMKHESGGRFAVIDDFNKNKIDLNNSKIIQLDTNEISNNIFSIEKIIAIDKKNLVIVGLGGETGTKFAEIVLNYFMKSNCNFKAICTIPFFFEGEYRRKKAMKALNNVKAISNIGIIRLDIIRDHYGNLTMDKAFHFANHFIYDRLKHREYTFDSNPKNSFFKIKNELGKGLLLI